MASLDDVRRAAESLPETTVTTKGSQPFAVEVAGKGIAWIWMERVNPGRPRTPNPTVLAVRVADTTEKEILLASDEKKFFTEPHYNGFPAVLVRLAEIDADELGEMILEAWRCRAPKNLVREAGL